MLGWAITFFVIALIAAVVFVILFIVSLLVGGFRQTETLGTGLSLLGSVRGDKQRWRRRQSNRSIR
ncbi:hypothetical protein Enr8_26590 [Blastopirellula retiformator]|uniref:Uncharacterized protein n=1 Tax=Blastopirellula retiformator TaxID=2527970 RepID=A0A5C5V547_9BACT|nr:hypothetical protein Enr8_26590 [Blastopirellula retiformator]